MAADRHVHVKLHADVDEYIEAMQRARAVTSSLAEELRGLGVSEADMPGAVKAVLKLVKGEDDGRESVAV